MNLHQEHHRLLAWAEATQPERCQRLTKTHGAGLLRRDVEIPGLKEPLMLAQFKPAPAITRPSKPVRRCERARVPTTAPRFHQHLADASTIDREETP